MKYTLIILGMLIINGCSNSEKTNDNFINYEAINSELVNELGINILAVKSKADLEFNKDDEFYNDLYEEILVGSSSNQFKRAGINYNLTNIDGDTLSLNNDSISIKMKVAFANHMIIDKQSPDYNIKLNWFQYMSGEKDAQFSYHFFLNDLKKMYDDEVITENEFHFLILFLHYQGLMTELS